MFCEVGLRAFSDIYKVAPLFLLSSCELLIKTRETCPTLPHAYCNSMCIDTMLWHFTCIYVHFTKFSSSFNRKALLDKLFSLGPASCMWLHVVYVYVQSVFYCCLQTSQALTFHLYIVLHTVFWSTCPRRQLHMWLYTQRRVENFKDKRCICYMVH